MIGRKHRRNGFLHEIAQKLTPRRHDLFTDNHALPVQGLSGLRPGGGIVVGNHDPVNAFAAADFEQLLRADQTVSGAGGVAV